MPEVIDDIADAWVRLFDDKSYGDRVLTVNGGTDHPNLDNVKSDDGKKGFGDKTSSVRFQIPKG